MNEHHKTDRTDLKVKNNLLTNKDPEKLVIIGNNEIYAFWRTKLVFVEMKCHEDPVTYKIREANQIYRK